MTPSAGDLSPIWVIAGGGAAALISVISVRARLLTAGGGVAQFVLGWLLIGLGGLSWALPIVVFFVSSSALSRWSAARRPDVHEQFSKGIVRDHWQVVANGGLAGVLVGAAFVKPWPIWFDAYTGVCAAAAADTWATEIGVLSRRDPCLLPSMRRVPAGTSGAITAIGTAGALLGAALIGAVAYGVAPGDAHPAAFISGLVGGISGAAADSIAGATVQARFQCPACGRLTERATHCGLGTELKGGFRPITNDAVNILCTVAGAAAAASTSLLVRGVW